MVEVYIFFSSWPIRLKLSLCKLCHSRTKITAMNLRDWRVHLDRMAFTHFPILLLISFFYFYAWTFMKMWSVSESLTEATVFHLYTYIFLWFLNGNYCICLSSLLVLYFRCFPVRKGEFVCGYSVTCVQHILHYKCDIYNAIGHLQTFNICSNTTASHSLRNYSYLCISVKYLHVLSILCTL